MTELEISDLRVRALELALTGGGGPTEKVLDRARFYSNFLCTGAVPVAQPKEPPVSEAPDQCL